MLRARASEFDIPRHLVAELAPRPQGLALQYSYTATLCP